MGCSQVLEGGEEGVGVALSSRHSRGLSAYLGSVSFYSVKLPIGHTLTLPLPASSGLRLP